MQMNEIIIKTRCGSLKSQEEAKFRDTHGTKFSKFNHDKSVLQFDAQSLEQCDSNLLKGHIFHFDCLKEWLHKGRVHFQKDSGKVYYCCPLCRRDMLVYEDQADGSIEGPEPHESMDTEQVQPMHMRIPSQLI